MRISDDQPIGRRQRGRVLQQVRVARLGQAQIGFHRLHLEELWSRQGNQRVGRPQEESEIVRHHRTDPRSSTKN